VYRMGGQFPWNEASYEQLQVLSYVPKLTSLLSIMGSCYILYDISRLKQRNTYHRIIFGMNVMDLLALMAWFFTTLPMPEGTDIAAGAGGNQHTCSAQGFFSQLSIATVLYNAALAIYFMLVIKYGWTEQRIVQVKYEYFIHTVAVLVGMGTAAVALAFELYNPAGWQCWIASSPVGCTESWEMEDENISQPGQQNDSNSSTAAEDAVMIVPCTRGDNASVFRWFFFFLPLWSCILVATVALYQVYSAFQKQDQVANKWRQKLMYATATPSKIIKKTTKATTWVAKKTTKTTVNATKKTYEVTSKSVQKITGSWGSLGNSSVRDKRTDISKPPRATIPAYTPAQKRKLQKSQSIEYDSEHPMQPNTVDPSGSDALEAQDSSIIKSALPTSGKGLPPVLGTEKYVGRTHSPAVDEVKRTSRAQKLAEKLRVRRPKRRKKQHSEKSKLVTSQALLYLLSFYMAWFFPSLTRIQQSVTSEGIAYYHWVLLSAIFVPLQGLLNFFVYIRPKILQIRREKQRAKTLQKRAEELEQRHAQQNQASTLGTHGDGRGSSSALMTIMSNSNDDQQESENTDCASNNASGNGPYNTLTAAEGQTATVMTLTESTLHRFNPDHPPADVERNDRGDDGENVDEDSFGEEDSYAMEDLYGSLIGSSQSKMDSSAQLNGGSPNRRAVIPRLHSSASNIEHNEAASTINKALAERFNSSVSYDSAGHVMQTSNTGSVEGNQTEQRLSGWRAFKQTVTVKLGRTTSLPSSTHSKTNSKHLRHSASSALSANSGQSFNVDDRGPRSSVISDKMMSENCRLDEYGPEIFEEDALQSQNIKLQDSSSEVIICSPNMKLVPPPTVPEDALDDGNDKVSRLSLSPPSMPKQSCSQPYIFTPRVRPSSNRSSLRRTKTDPDDVKDIREQFEARRRNRNPNRIKVKDGVAIVDESAQQQKQEGKEKRSSSKQRQMLAFAKDNWVSKKGVTLVKQGIKGGKKVSTTGVKTIKHLASDFRDALKTGDDYMDDWATALEEDLEDIIFNDDKKTEGEKKIATHVVGACGIDADKAKGSLRYDNVREEEKEEIDAIREEEFSVTSSNNSAVQKEPETQQLGSVIIL